MTESSTELVYATYISCNNTICTDTRNILSGSLFFCLKGASFNGNAYAAEALEKGASYAVIDEAEYFLDHRTILVSDALLMLQNLAAWHRKQIATHILAIGGSNGKTTTKELCAKVLGSRMKVLATKANHNNHIGVPLTLLSLRGDEAAAIVELGTNHPGEMAVLCNMVNPDSGIVTNIGKEHLEGFGSMEGVAREESELFLNLIQNGGRAFCNVDDTWLQSMCKRLENRITYGIEGAADLRGEILESMPFLKFRLHYQETDLGIFTAQLGGTFNLYNILAAIAAGVSLGMTAEDSANAACAYKPENNRSEWIEKNGKRILLDAYNANPSSMELAVQEFAKLPGSKALFLGDMLELGSYAEAEHKELFALAQSLGFDEIYLCGAHFQEIAKGYPSVFENVDALCQWLSMHPSKAQNALIKGSRGVKMEKVLEIL